MNDILSTPIDELDFSEFFLIGCEAMGYQTLSMIVNDEIKVMMAKDGFNHVWFAELNDFLIDRNLIHLLQSPQGNSRV